MFFGSPTFHRFLGYARRYWKLILASISCGILKFSLALLLPYSVGLVTDYVILADIDPDLRYKRLLGILFLLAASYLLRIPIAYYRGFFAEMAGNRTIFDIRSDLYRHVQRLSLAYHARHRTGETTSRITNDVNTVQGILDRGVMSMTIDFLFLIGVVIFLFFWDWKLAAVSLFTLPLYAVVFGVINPRLRKSSRTVQRRMAEMSGEIQEKVSGLPVVLAFGREPTERRLFFQQHRKYFRAVIRQIRFRVLLHSLGEFLTTLGPVIVISYGSIRVIQGQITLGELLIFNGFLAHLYLPTRRLADASAVVQVQLAAMDRVFEVMDVAPDIQDAPDASPLRLEAGAISFDQVSFAYYPDQPVLHTISLEVAAGKAVALVGRSGAGKSTLINLVPRFYDVDSGAIRIDGQDIRRLSQRSLRSHIAMVMQDNILFSGSIRENILYGRHGATENEMIEAACMAHVDEFVAELAQGYDTLIGERGITLSGGQKQRLSIARAFLRNPRILILDEATSNLDSHAENIIQDALSKLMQGRTTLIIAHRLSTIVDCDLVVVLEEGRIVQQGRHEELLAKDGAYRDLCQEQFGGIQF